MCALSLLFPFMQRYCLLYIREASGMEEVLFLCRTPGGIGHGRDSA